MRSTSSPGSMWMSEAPEHQRAQPASRHLRQPLRELLVEIEIREIDPGHVELLGDRVDQLVLVGQLHANERLAQPAANRAAGGHPPPPPRPTSPTA